MDPNLPTGETMSEGSDQPPMPPMPPMPEEQTETPTGLEQRIPIEVLQQPDEGDQLTAPEVGDEVDFTVSGKVTRIEGAFAYVLPSTVNGQEVKGDAPAEGGDTLASLEAEAGRLSL